MDESGLARIEEQIRAEAGDSWTTHPMIVRGRNAVRAENALAPPGAPPRAPAGAGDPGPPPPMIVRGRNAVRAEHALAPLGAPPREPARDCEPTEHPLWRRLVGKAAKGGVGGCGDVATQAG